MEIKHIVQIFNITGHWGNAVKTTMRSPCLPVRVAKLKNMDNTKIPKDVENWSVIQSCSEQKIWKSHPGKYAHFLLKSSHTFTTEASRLHPRTFIQEKGKLYLHENLLLDARKSLSVRVKT